ncbi:MAG: septum formation family protein [Acidimicrobiales bacterium]
MRRPNRTPFVSVSVAAAATGPSGTVLEDLGVGACVLAMGQTSVGRVQTVPCASPHRDEVYLVTREAAPGPKFGWPPGSAPYPGEDALAAGARQICHDRFADYVGQPVEASELTFSSVHPSQASWAQGRRGIVCPATRPDDAPLTGSVRGGG